MWRWDMSKNERVWLHISYPAKTGKSKVTTGLGAVKPSGYPAEQGKWLVTAG